MLWNLRLSKKGTLIRLNDINFYVNTFAVMPSSKRAIDELIYVMNKNPKLKIEIQGHICCQNKYQPDIISTDRAKAIYTYLVKNEISTVGCRWLGKAEWKKL